MHLSKIHSFKIYFLIAVVMEVTDIAKDQVGVGEVSGLFGFKDLTYKF